jgi:hypothetical protein
MQDRGLERAARPRDCRPHLGPQDAIPHLEQAQYLKNLQRKTGFKKELGREVGEILGFGTNSRALIFFAFEGFCENYRNLKNTYPSTLLLEGGATDTTQRPRQRGAPVCDSRVGVVTVVEHYWHYSVPAFRGYTEDLTS